MTESDRASLSKFTFTNMSKRSRPEPGFYRELQKISFERRRRLLPRKEVLPDLYFVERLVAKRKVGKETQFLVKWENYGPEEITWEPVQHLPDMAVSTFENPPQLDPEWISEARKRLALILERGLKSNRTTDVTVEFRHILLRHLFPRLPSHLSSTPFLATKEDFVGAGLEGYIERFVTVTGGRRQVMFPVLIKPQLGRAPVFLTADGDPAPTRQLEKVKISFNKSC